MILNEPILQHIFATPLYINNINREFSKKETSYISKVHKELVKNTSNSYTKDSYII